MVYLAFVGTRRIYTCSLDCLPPTTRDVHLATVTELCDKGMMLLRCDGCDREIISVAESVRLWAEEHARPLASALSATAQA